MVFSFLTVDWPAPHVARLTLNRPHAANALNTAMAEEISFFFSQLGKGARAVVLTGSGERAFCAGADLKERQGMNETQWEVQHAALRAARDGVLNCPLPVIAAVNGAAFGGGLELALACDFIYAADTARFALPEARLGIMPGMGGTQTLPRAVGERRAKEMVLTGESISAQEALAWGLINRLFSSTELPKASLAAACAIAVCAPLSTRALKRTVHEGLPAPLAEGIALEREAYQQLIHTADRSEGIAAFNEKRKPVFRGE